MQTQPPLPSWVIDAAQIPVAFAQVREDALLDRWVIERIEADAPRVVAVASGGCTAAALAASGRVAYLHLVDLNPAQIALSRLKLHLLQTVSPRQRAELLGHAPLAAEERAERLSQAFEMIEVPADCLGPLPLVAGAGPDDCGRYELLFARMRFAMRGYESQWADLLMLDDASKRVARAAPDSDLGKGLDAALEEVMALPNLVRLFSAEATRNGREPFANHFARRIRQALAADSTRDNPYLWQMLLGRFPQHVRYPWLDAPVLPRMPEVTTSVSAMDAVLAASKGEFDYVHLSNILDWLDPEHARRMLELAFDALRPGGFTLIRQLNSTLDIPSLCNRLEWLPAQAAAMHARDRSFFYHALHLVRRR
jgi:S-adenosylmethionine-diacylglycerol 3-amino-3-carboxypropyl transferase